MNKLADAYLETLYAEGLGRSEPLPPIDDPANAILDLDVRVTQLEATVEESTRQVRWQAENMLRLFERVRESFERQGMMRHLGARLLRVEHGLCEIVLPYSDQVTQQQGGFHGGAVGAVADIAGGYAALTLAPEGMEVTTVEFKINFLAAYRDGELHACGRVLRAGRRIIVTSAEVAHVDAAGKHSACAVMQQTLAPVPKHY